MEKKSGESSGVAAEQLSLEELFGMPTEEGEGTPSAAAPAAKASPGEGGDAPKREEASEKVVPKERFDEVYEQAKRYEQWKPVLDLFEDDPATARRLVIEKLRGTANVPEQPSSQPVQPQYTEEQVRAYWTKRFEEDPAGTLTELIYRVVEERQKDLLRHIEPVKRVAVKAVVRDFKAEARESDPLFARYESVFDRILSETDPTLIEANPDLVLQRAKAMAFGLWAEDQRRKAAMAGTKRLPRETPPAEVAAGAAPPQQQQAKPKRAPVREEIILAERYGIPLDELLTEEEEPESPFTRGGR